MDDYGKPLYVKMTKEKFEEKLGEQTDFKQNEKLSIETLGQYRVYSSVPVYLNEDTQGEYEVVCENGIEFH